MPTHEFVAPQLTRWQIAWRLAAVWATGALFWFQMYLAGLEVGIQAPTDAMTAIMVADIVMGQLSVLAYAFHRRWPLPTAVFTSGMSWLSLSSIPAAAAGLISVSARHQVKEIAVVVAVWLGAGIFHESVVWPNVWQDQDLDLSDGWTWTGFAVAILFTMVLVLIGWSIGARRRLLATLRLQADTAQREQASRVSQARLAERARIAREMHDVLGHRLSLVAVHAGAIAARPDLSEDERVEAASTVRSAAHQALEDLRETLGVLRDEAPQTVLNPQPEFADIPDLVAEHSSETTGDLAVLHATDDLWDRARSLPSTTGRHTYRVIQEALTNARKHAPGQQVTITMRGRSDVGLKITAANRTVPGTNDSHSPRSGVGLTGMRERVDLAGGTMEVAIRDGTFVISLWLPWHASE